MKSTIFREIINEEFIEVNKSMPKTIKCLCEQSQVWHISSPNNIRIYFKCSKKGKFSVKGCFDRRESLYPIYYVCGDVVSKNNKTYVKIISVYKKSDIWLRRFLLISIVPLLILKIFLEGSFYIPAILASFVVLLIVMIDFINTTYIRKNRGLEIVKLLENELKKRVQNINRWDN